MTEKSKLLLACHPNFLMNVSHACTVAANPEARNTPFYKLSERSVTYWTQLEGWCASDEDVVFYQHANAIMLSYARAISGAYRLWRSEIELAHRQFETNERQIANVRVLALRVGLRIIQSLFKMLLVLVFGYVLTYTLGKAFVPGHVTAEVGVRLPATLGALSMGLIAMIAGTFRQNRLWSSAAAELSWRLGAAEEELERASIEAFDLHWSEFCGAYRAYSGRDYALEPSFINIMRSKLRARERWNGRRPHQASANLRRAVTMIQRYLWRKYFRPVSKTMRASP